MFRLDNKVALITGATGGIGGEVVRVLHSLGATVIAVGRCGDKLDKFKAQFENDNDRILTLACDLADLNSIDEFAKSALELAGGKIDILINNAGLTKDGLMMRMTDEAWQDVIDVNLTANFKLTRAIMPSMMKARYGRIISVASVVGVMGNGGQVNYAASKGGLIAMSKSLAVEVASRGITVNTVAPGFIQTAMTDVLSDDIKASLNAQIPSKTFGTPSDVAYAIAFLASEESAYITGQTLNVNGGMLRV